MRELSLLTMMVIQILPHKAAVVICALEGRARSLSSFLRPGVGRMLWFW